MDDFVNLHVHTEASLQDSVIRIPQLIKQVKEYQQSAVAVTDHSSCASWVEFSRAATEADIHPIFGNEFYCQPKGVSKERNRDHLVLLAMNEDGLINIRRLQRLAVENYYYRPILNYQVLEDNPHNGIYCTSACSLSTISKKILSNDIDGAIDYAGYFKDLFDGNFALELQFHPGYEDQNIINEQLVEISEKLNIPLTVSCDSHFINKDDKDLRRIVQAISWKRQYKDVGDSLKTNCLGNSDLIKQFAIESNFKYMHVVSQAIYYTKVIAEKCQATLEEPERRIPVFDKHREFNELFEVVEW